jgi:hypothetical protein
MPLYRNYINKTISFKSGDNVTRRRQVTCLSVTEKIDQGGSGQFSNEFINQGGSTAVYADFIKILNPLNQTNLNV